MDSFAVAMDAVLAAPINAAAGRADMLPADGHPVALSSPDTLPLPALAHGAVAVPAGAALPEPAPLVPQLADRVDADAGGLAHSAAAPDLAAAPASDPARAGARGLPAVSPQVTTQTATTQPAITLPVDDVTGTASPEPIPHAAIPLRQQLTPMSDEAAAPPPPRHAGAAVGPAAATGRALSPHSPVAAAPVRIAVPDAPLPGVLAAQVIATPGMQPAARPASESAASAGEPKADGDVGTLLTDAPNPTPVALASFESAAATVPSASDMAPITVIAPPTDQQQAELSAEQPAEPSAPRPIIGKRMKAELALSSTVSSASIAIAIASAEPARPSAAVGAVERREAPVAAAPGEETAALVRSNKAGEDPDRSGSEAMKLADIVSSSAALAGPALAGPALAGGAVAAPLPDRPTIMAKAATDTKRQTVSGIAPTVDTAPGSTPGPELPIADATSAKGLSAMPSKGAPLPDEQALKLAVVEGKALDVSPERPSAMPAMPAADGSLRAALATGESKPLAPAIPVTPVIEARPGQIGHDVGVAIAHRLSAGGEELVVRLVPAELGRIEVRMSFDERSGLRAVIAADSPVALDMLRRDSADLSRALSDAGVRSDSQSLRFQTDGGNGGGNGSAGNQQRNPWRDADAHAGRAQRDDIAGDAAPIAYRPIRTSGSYNLLA